MPQLILTLSLEAASFRFHYIGILMLQLKSLLTHDGTGGLQEAFIAHSLLRAALLLVSDRGLVSDSYT